MNNVVNDIARCFFNPIILSYTYLLCRVESGGRGGEGGGGPVGGAAPPSKLGLFTLAGAVIVVGQIGCEIGKQVCNYSVQYYNGGQYPLPQVSAPHNWQLSRCPCRPCWWCCWSCSSWWSPSCGPAAASPSSTAPPSAPASSSSSPPSSTR